MDVGRVVKALAFGSWTDERYTDTRGPDIC